MVTTDDQHQIHRLSSMDDTVDLSFQQLIRVPNDWTVCEQTRFIVLAGNPLRSPKRSPSGQSGSLDLSGCALSHLPSWIFELPKLRVLNLSMNPPALQTLY